MNTGSCERCDLSYKITLPTSPSFRDHLFKDSFHCSLIIKDAVDGKTLEKQQQCSARLVFLLECLKLIIQRIME
jgi:hypothetical protein